MQLNTRIFNSKNEQVSFKISKQIGEAMWGGMRTEVQLLIKDKEIGFMSFSIGKDHLYIHRMYNHSVKSEAPYKHVGALLLEYAFRKSLAAGKEGRIELKAIGASPAFYYKMGLRGKGIGGLFLQELITEYLSTYSSQIKDKILTDDLYPTLQEDAAKNIKKEVKHVSFEEAIKYGLYSTANYAFEEKLASKKQLTANNCYEMQDSMYLPTEMIEFKKREFFSFKPIGSNWFFSKQEAENRLKSPELIHLVKANKLDSSNAIEIEAKIEIDSEQWRILLSPCGLKMMKRNYISGWYVGVYFHDIEDLQMILSPNGLEAFERGYIKNISQLLNLGFGPPAQILNDPGLQLLRNGDVIISETGCNLKNREGNILSRKDLIKMLKIGFESRNEFRF